MITWHDRARPTALPNIRALPASRDTYDSPFRRMSMSTRRYFIVAMLGLAVGACGGKKGGSAPVPQPRTSVRVENQGFSDMTIYAIRSGQRVRLGNAPGN